MLLENTLSTEIEWILDHALEPLASKLKQDMAYKRETWHLLILIPMREYLSSIYTIRYSYYYGGPYKLYCNHAWCTACHSSTWNVYSHRRHMRATKPQIRTFVVSSNFMFKGNRITRWWWLGAGGGGGGDGWGGGRGRETKTYQILSF